MKEVLLNVLCIILLIIGGGFAIYLMSSLVIHIYDNQKAQKESKGRRPKLVRHVEKEAKLEEGKSFVLDEEPKKEQDEQDETVVSEEDDMIKDINLGEAKNEEKQLTGKNEIDDFDSISDDKPEYIQNELEESQEEVKGFEALRAEEEKYRQEKIRQLEEKRMAMKEFQFKDETELENTSEDKEEIDLNDLFFNDQDIDFGKIDDKLDVSTEKSQGNEFNSFDLEDLENEEKIEEEISMLNVDDQPKTVEDVINPQNGISDNEILKAELERQKAEYEAFMLKAKEENDKLLEEKQALLVKFDEIEKENEKPLSAPSLTLAEYEENLEVLRERLKNIEKDFKTNKKEFLPLARVRKTYDNDNKKLRRREALVARQKVELYGVNNYADIDQEKAKQLAEDMDLLDGLRLSVQHCQEVLEKNKERYPILETLHRVLKTNIEELKADIAKMEHAIELLKSNQND